MNTRQTILIATLVLASTSVTCKSVDYNAELLAVPEVPDAAAVPDGDFQFVPAVACADPTEAILSIENFAYNIVCGCEESEGKTCTLAEGMRVTWRFADSEEHNVTSIPNNFGMSGDTLAGEFNWEFDAKGDYGYGCTIHIADMSGYKILVK